MGEKMKGKCSVKTSLEKIINRIADKSQLVIGYDLSFLDKAKQLNKCDDVHYMHKGIVQIESEFKIDTFGLKKIIADIEFEALDIGTVIQEDFEEDYGLYLVSSNQTPSDFMYRLFWENTFDSLFKGMSVNEISLTNREFNSAVEVLCYFAQSFECFRLYNVALFQYMFYILSDPKMYDRDCLKNMFFIAYSEFPSLVEAVEHIEFGEVDKICGLKIYGKDILLSQFLSVLVQDILNGKYAGQLSVDNSGILFFQDYIKILKCFEIEA